MGAATASTSTSGFVDATAVEDDAAFTTDEVSAALSVGVAFTPLAPRLSLLVGGLSTGAPADLRRALRCATAIITRLSSTNAPIKTKNQFCCRVAPRVELDDEALDVVPLSAPGGWSACAICSDEGVAAGFASALPSALP